MILSANCSGALHHLRNLLLVGLSLSLLPFSISVVALAKLLSFLSIVKAPNIQPASSHGRQIRVLVTGVSMAKGLFLCRSFYLGGCSVLALDFEKGVNAPCGRFSKAISRYYHVSNPADIGIATYVAEITQIVKTESIDLCVTCSGVATALADAKLVQFLEKNTKCKIFQLKQEAVEILDNKLKFMQCTDSLHLTNTEWYPLSTGKDVPLILGRLQDKKGNSSKNRYIVKNVGVDDASRGAIPVLDLARPSELRSILMSLEFGNGKTWIIQEFLSGEEYCTQAIIVDGIVTAFAACPSASVLMHYQVLDSGSQEYNEMLDFSRSYASALYKRLGSFTGHLSFDFISRDGLDNQSLVPIECNPRCHTATVVFRGLEVELTKAYLSSLSHNQNPSNDILEVDSKHADSYYWAANDLVALLISPFFQFIDYSHFSDNLRRQTQCITHFLTWRDPTFEWWDPLPWFVLNHVYWPLELLMASINGVRWKQLNVSTTKMFKY